MSNPQIGFVLGSANDLPQLERAEAFLKKAEIPYEVRILSAHRTPAEAHEYASTAESRGLKVLVGMAGVAAHLAGALAANSALPVLGVPAAGGALNGFDALLSTVQMPGGVPVATFAIGKSGALNAAIFACQVIGLSDTNTAQKVAAFKAQQTKAVLEADAERNS
ncbi:MAG: 5-(carboxyamino)imidazole ribonucleotide mutase [Planctomycetota bacterium]|jgi:5-(carboxyamino)imidazole ribonucleotide mutase